jgi:hypothetical protein
LVSIRKDPATVNLVTNKNLDLVLDLAGTSSISAAGPLYNCTIGLYTTDIDILPTTPLATFTAAEANYDGYLRQVVGWLAPSRSDTGAIEVLSNANTFRPTDAVVTNTVYGCFVILAGSGSLGFAGRFDDAPKSMQDTHSVIVVTLSWSPISGGYAYASP